MFVRECEKADKGVARMVPKLREVHIIRDSWTKLNVAPAKIMQVSSFIFMRFVYNFDSPFEMLLLAKICVD